MSMSSRCVVCLGESMSERVTSIVKANQGWLEYKLVEVNGPLGKQELKFIV